MVVSLYNMKQKQLFVHSAYFYGDVEPSDEPGCWQEQVAALIALHRQAPVAGLLEKKQTNIKSVRKIESKNTIIVPLIINTHGWIDGVGRDLLQFVVRTAVPDAIVELQFSLVGDSLAAKLVTDLEQSSTSTTTTKNNSREEEETDVVGSGRAVGSDRQTVRFVIPSAVDVGTRQPQLEAVTQRRLAILRHCSASARVAALLGVPVRRVAFDAIRISVPTQIAPRHALRALNGALVALCCDASLYGTSSTRYDVGSLQLFAMPPRTATCLALGVVRCVDAQQRAFFVSTSLADDLLQHVNTLVLGALTLATDVVTQSAKSVLSIYCSFLLSIMIFDSSICVL